MFSRRILLAAAIGLALAAAYVLRVRKDMTDLDVCLRAGHRMLAGETLYRATDGHLQFKYSPPSAVLFIPLSLLPEDDAKLFWYVFEFACLAGVCLLSLKILPARERAAAPLLALTTLVLLKLLAREIELGQINLLILFLLTLSVWLLIEGRDVASGLAWGLSLLFKPYALVLLPYFLVKKRFKAAAVGLGLVLAALAVPSLFFGVRGNLEVLRAWPATLSRSTRGLLAVYDNASLAGFLLKTFHALAARTAEALIGLAALAAALGILWMIARSKTAPAGDRHPEALECAALLVLMPLLSPLGWNYNYLYAWLAVMLVLSAFRELPSAWRVVLVVDFAIIAASLVETWGHTAFHFYTRQALVAVNFLIVLAALFTLRAKRLA